MYTAKLYATVKNGPYTNKLLKQNETGRTTRRNRHSEQTLFNFYSYFIFNKMIYPGNVELPPLYGQCLALYV